MKALEDLRVLDLTHAHEGPMCTMFLADMGAEVIKIEPTWGERTRFFPPLIKGTTSPYFLYLNRNKKGLTLNLKSEKGVKIFKDLVSIVDVVVENFSPGTMDRLGLGYETLKKINPKIIFASLSGFGQYGPYSKRLSFDPIAIAASGYMELMREKVDPSGPPVGPPEAIADTIPALFCAIGILSALRYRERTGQGQRIDIAQMDCMVGVSPSYIFHTLAGTTFEGSFRKFRKTLQLSGLYKAKDGYIMITVPGEMLERLAKAIGVETEKIESQEYVKEWVRGKNVSEVVDLLVRARVPVSSVNSLEDVINDPNIRAREMIVEVSHPVIGKVKMPGFPIKFSETPVKIKDPAPMLGQHNDEILSTLLDYSKEEISKLKEEGVI